jgi:hypothetical protein
MKNPQLGNWVGLMEEALLRLRASPFFYIDFKDDVNGFFSVFDICFMSIIFYNGFWTH